MERTFNNKLHVIAKELSQQVGHDCDIAIGSTGLLELDEEEVNQAGLWDKLDEESDDYITWSDFDYFPVDDDHFFLKEERKFYQLIRENSYQIMSNHEFFNWYLKERNRKQFFIAPGEAAFYYLTYFIKWRSLNL